jgi:propane monooxygenase reductase subunit
VLFEPIGEAIDCDFEETVLDAAFRQGYNLVYGCREGQCSACKSFLLEGDVTLRPHSSFALSESEEDQGYTLLCRAMPDDDLVVELLHYDPDSYRLDNPIADGRAHVVSVDALTHDIRGLTLRVDEPRELAFRAGQYIDLWVPGRDERRSFSIATLPGDPVVELIVKRYPAGLFSALLDGRINPGDELRFTGPYGAFYLRPGDRDALLVAGGSGMAPVLGILRQLAAEGTRRRVRFFYGARTRADLFHLDTVAALGDRIADFQFTPVLSDGTAGDGWGGRRGMVHEAVAGYMADGDLTGPEVYACGPPPMVDAVAELLIDRFGVAESDVHFDKFTTAAAADDAAWPRGGAR